MQITDKQSKRAIQIEIYAEPSVQRDQVNPIRAMLDTAGRLWSELNLDNEDAKSSQVGVVADKLLLPEDSQIDINQPGLDLGYGRNTDLIILPHLPIALDTPLAPRYQRTIEWLRNMHQHEQTSFAAIGSGTVLLAAAGLLNKSDATVPWTYVRYMQKYFPQVKLHPNRTICSSGHRSRVVTSGGETAWQPTLLYLVSRYFGAGHVRHVAQHISGPGQPSQYPGSLRLIASLLANDAVIRVCQRWLHQNLSAPKPVHQMVMQSQLSQRKFHRVFKLETGFAPLDYLHLARIEEAKWLLRNTKDPIEAIAEQIGYHDQHYFNQIFQRNVGVTARQYRLPMIEAAADIADSKKKTLMIWHRIEKIRRDVHCGLIS
jgi:transcriptional regulator GlxA family with amidase domain